VIEPTTQNSKAKLLKILGKKLNRCKIIIIHQKYKMNFNKKIYQEQIANSNSVDKITVLYIYLKSKETKQNTFKIWINK
jgi:hypothetical protein